MHSVVAIKQVPDTSNVRINPETGTLIREGVPTIINPYDIHAVEMAVRIKENFGGKVTVITMGPPKAIEALIECVEQGADRAILISDRRFGAADTLATSYVLAHTIEALQQEGPVDLLLFGKQAIDGDTAQVGPGVATRLQVPLLSNAVEIEFFDPVARKAVVHRKIEQGIEVIETSLPALLTVEKEIAAVKRAPLPNLINAARYKPELWTGDTPVRFDPDAGRHQGLAHDRRQGLHADAARGRGDPVGGREGVERGRDRCACDDRPVRRHHAPEPQWR